MLPERANYAPLTASKPAPHSPRRSPEGLPARIRAASSQRHCPRSRSQLRVAATPAYLAAHGTPTSPEDLQRHACIAWQLSHGGLYRRELEREGEALPLSLPTRGGHRNGGGTRCDSGRPRTRVPGGKPYPRRTASGAAGRGTGRGVPALSRPMPPLPRSPPPATGTEGTDRDDPRAQRTPAGH